MNREILRKYHEWLNGEFLSPEDKKILENMTEEEIIDSFSSDLEFGTAGIRGIMGLGTNRINKYNIGKVTLGLANYLNKKYAKSRVVIGYDTRKNSREFAFRSALILNSEGIETYIFKDVVSSPEIAFATQYLKCNAGIVITSSHNPKEYNGYKVYNKFGAQIISPEDKDIIKEINLINDLSLVKEEIINNPLFNYVPSDESEEFSKENEKVFINKNIVLEYAQKLKITYTSFHGVGIKIVPFLFEKYKIRYNLVNEQCKIDENFSYAPSPNPEYEYNYDLAKEYATELDSDVIISTDPDADRMGLLYKTYDGYKMLDGNMIGSVMLYYLLNNKKVVKNNYIVRSIVSTSLADKIADYYNTIVKEVLTGCKNIAREKIKDPDNYLFGFEESLGYMFDINVNDKNSFSSILFMIEILSYLKSNNRSLEDYIEEIENKFGYYNTYTLNLNFEKSSDITSLMDKIRNKDLFKLEKIDYLVTGEDKLKTNAIKFIVEDDVYFIIRPSGTENKVKIYFIVKSNSKYDSKRIMDELINYVENKIK